MAGGEAKQLGAIVAKNALQYRFRLIAMTVPVEKRTLKRVQVGEFVIE